MARTSKTKKAKKSIKAFIEETLPAFDTDRDAAEQSYWQEFMAYDYAKIAETILESGLDTGLCEPNGTWTREALKEAMEEVLKMDDSMLKGLEFDLYATL